MLCHWPGVLSKFPDLSQPPFSPSAGMGGCPCCHRTVERGQVMWMSVRSASSVIPDTFLLNFTALDLMYQLIFSNSLITTCCGK